MTPLPIVIAYENAIKNVFLSRLSDYLIKGLVYFRLILVTRTENV